MEQFQLDLPTFWFFVLALFWVGYFVLEGFDFGVGMLLGVLGRDNTDRRVLINTIGPHWDGNEVWLVVAGAGTFAAFPIWYATLFSSYFLPLLLIVVALVVRAVAFEYRGKHSSARWSANWDRAIMVCSLLPALLWGVALSGLLNGIPIDGDQQFAGNLLDLVQPYTLLGGLTTLSLCVLNGSVFLGMKTEDELRARARALSARFAPVVVVLVTAFTAWTAWGVEGEIIPNLLTLGAGSSITVEEAASGSYTLTVMTIVAILVFPVVLAYQAVSYYAFRARVGREQFEGVAQAIGTVADKIGITEDEPPQSKVDSPREGGH